MIIQHRLQQTKVFAQRLWTTELRAHIAVVAVLALQFCVFQLLLNVQYDDAPRNLHWGISTAEYPTFLINAPDTYVRIKGFPPDPPSLSSKALYESESLYFHPWWGPFFPLLFAGVWKASHSYMVLHQLVPLAAGVTVVLIYLLAARLLSPNGGLLAAALFALLPLVREYAVISYVECLSALVLFVALYSLASHRMLLAVGFGLLTALSKRDTAFLYLGVGVGVAVWDYWRGQRVFSLRYLLIVLGLPALAYGAWSIIVQQRSSANLGGWSWDLFVITLPQMVPLFFYIPWLAAWPTLLLLGWLAVRGWNSLPESIWKPLLGLWTILGWIILLIYAGTQGAGNSPRVIIPCLPPMAILAASGLLRLSAPWRRRLGFYLIALFLAVNVAVTYFQYLKSQDLALYRPVFTWLREQPRGFVLTDHFWPTVLYARQPVTWFEFDPVFEQNIMRDSANFQRYVTAHQIRYVVLPPDEQLAADEVRDFLEQHAQRQPIGPLTIYRLY